MLATFVLTSFDGAEGERDDDGLFSPFHRGWPLEDDNENRYDALTVSGFGHAPSQLQADDTVRRLVKSDLIELEPLPYGYPRPAFVAGMLNYVRMHFLSKLRGEGVKEEQRTLIERALDAPLDRVVDVHGAAISALMTRAVLLKTAAGPAALFWPQTPDHICLAMPLGEEIYSDFVASEAQLRVASHFIEALGLDRGGASVGDSAALQLGGLPGALAGTHPLVVVHRDSDGRYRHRIDPSWPQPFSR